MKLRARRETDSLQKSISKSLKLKLYCKNAAECADECKFFDGSNYAFGDITNLIGY